MLGKTLFCAVSFITIACHTLSAQTNDLGGVVCRVNVDSAGIYCDENGEGPIGFSVLDSNTFGLWNGNEILILSDGGQHIERISTNIETAEHLDFTKDGNGLVASYSGLYRMRDFQIEQPALDVKFSREGGESFRIDLMPNDSVRIIGRSRDFVLRCLVEDIESVTLPNIIDDADKLVVDNSPLFVGEHERKSVFFRIDFLQAPDVWQVFQYSPGTVRVERMIKVTGVQLGHPFLFSFPYRMDRDGDIYVMLNDNRDLVIWKLDYKCAFPEPRVKDN